MMRMLFWFFLVFIVWKIVEIIAAPSKRPPPKQGGRRGQKDSTFSDVEEAEYEDVTTKTGPSDHKSS